MTDDLRELGPADRARIDLSQSNELRYWTEALGCTESELRDAVFAVGDSAAAVSAYLEARFRALRYRFD
jgi:hypothetical protein